MRTDYLDGFHRGEILAASRIMSIVERGGEGAESILNTLFPKVGRSYRIGVTGLTGSGKSTLVNELTKRFRQRDLTVGVVAEDPTSPFSGGAILGDRVRMQDATGDEGVFIRSIASRGSETGFSACATELADVLDAFGRDVIFLDKADRSNAQRYANDLTSILELTSLDRQWIPPVVSTVAVKGEGIEELMAAIDRHRAFLDEDDRFTRSRVESLQNRITMVVEDKLKEIFWQDDDTKRKLEEMLKEVVSGKKSPYQAANEIIAKHTVT
jgi:LAO/AO transport system kinase